MTEQLKTEQTVKRREYFKKLRNEAYAILGGKCSSCGETDYTVLCIDHIQPVRRLRRQTISLHCEIRNDPDIARKKFLLLCRNCNWRKMIENNERESHERQFAYACDFENLLERVQHLEHKLEIRMEKNKTENKTNNKTEMTEQQIEEIIYPNISTLKTAKGCLDVAAMRLFLRESGIEISSWKAYNIKRNLELRFPELFRQ